MSVSNSWSRTAVLVDELQMLDLNDFRECLVIKLSRSSGDTKWSQLEEQVVHAVTVFWVTSEGFPFQVCDNATLLFLFAGEAERNERNFDAKLPVSVEEFSTKLSPIVLSLGERDAYRRLLSHVNPQIAKRLLLKANDIAALFAFKRNKNEYKAARALDSFDRVMLRTDEQRFAFISLDSLLKEDKSYSGVNIASVSADVEIAPNLKLEAEFQFDGVLGQVAPINVVIGPNGAGKTRLLLGIAMSSLNGTLRILSADHDGMSAKAHCSVLISAYTFETQHWAKLRRRGANLVPLGISAKNWRTVSGMIQKIAMVSPAARFEIRALNQVLTRVLNVEDIYLPALPNSGHTDIVANQDVIPFSTFVESQDNELVALLEIGKPPIMYSEEKGVYQLSSGQKSLFCFCASLFLHTTRGSLLLIDEPENHLHPQFITLLMQTLASSLIAKEAKAIVVTHSPFVVSEVEKKSVLVLRSDEEGLPAIYRPSLQTFGANVSLISDYVFEDVDIRKGYEEKIDEYINAPESRHSTDRLKLLGENFGSDAMSYARTKYKGKFDA
ncbi:AAA family ATPase [Massilia varians]